MLFSKSSTHRLPVLNTNKPLSLSLGVEIAQIISVDERSQQIKFKLWTRMKWKNEFLTWDPKNWSNIENVKAAADLVWAPDITLYDDIDEKQEAGSDKYKTSINIAANGENSWNAPGIFTSICTIDVQYFPFDVQYCLLKFGSWEHDRTELMLVRDNSPPITDKYKNSSEWDLMRVEVNVNNVKYACCEHPFQDISFKFVIHRRPLYYIFNVIIPCIILMTLILFSFFLPPDSGERIAVVITVLLAFTVILQLINKSLPRNSDTAPVLSVFYLTIMGESTMSLITTCMVLIAHHKGKERWVLPLPNWLKSYINKISKPIGVSKTNTNEAFQKSTRSNVVEYKACNNIETTNDINLIDSNHYSGYSTGMFEECAESMRHVHNTAYIQNTKLDHILSEVNIITSLIEEQNVRDTNELEWRHFGRVLDRLFFFFFVILFLMSTLIILLPAYFGHTKEDKQ